MLQSAFDLTDWELLLDSGCNVDESADIINYYVSFCADLHIASKSVVVYPNNKPWITKGLKALMQERKTAFNNKDTDRAKMLNVKLRREIANAKRAYGEKLKNCFRSNKPKDAWKCLEKMTDYSSKRGKNAFLHEPNPKQRADELNSFYGRFENDDFREYIEAQEDELRQCPDQPITIAEDEVRYRFKCINPKKSAGPDGISGQILKNCSSELAIPYAALFQRSVNEARIPACWKASTILPVPKSARPSTNNDFRPIALTSLVMKCLERIILQHLIHPIREQIDRHQFAYQSNRSVHDATLTLTDAIYRHLDTPRSYARATFIDFSSAFNTIQPHRLIGKLKDLKVKPSLILWISNFLRSRTQRVRVLDCLSDEITTNTGTAQGCVLSPSLFILYTNDCKIDSDCVKLIKYADDTVILGLVKDSETEYRSCVDYFANWCKDNYLRLNASKTKEMVFDFRVKRNPDPLDCPMFIDGQEIEVTSKYKYLGTIIDSQLTWVDQTKEVATKSNQRMYFLRKLLSFNVDRTIMTMFYKSVIESVITFGSCVWYNNARQVDKGKLRRIVKLASKILVIQTDLDEICKETALSKAKEIVKDVTHPLNVHYNMLRSGRRWQSIKVNTNRYRNSFIPYSVRLLNE